MLKTVQFIETLCKGDIVVRDIKTAKIIFSPLQNFQLHYCRQSEEPY